MNMLKHRLSGLLRTRVLLSVLGLILTYKKPEIGAYVAGIIGIACSVSAVDAYRQGSNGEKRTDKDG